MQEEKRADFSALLKSVQGTSSADASESQLIGLLSASFLGQVEAHLSKLTEWFTERRRTMTDGTLARMYTSAMDIWEGVKKAGPEDGPTFMFRDGPVTRAARLGKMLILEVMHTRLTRVNDG